MRASVNMGSCAIPSRGLVNVHQDGADPVVRKPVCLVRLGRAVPRSVTVPWGLLATTSPAGAAARRDSRATDARSLVQGDVTGPTVSFRVRVAKTSLATPCPVPAFVRLASPVPDAKTVASLENLVRIVPRLVNVPRLMPFAMPRTDVVCVFTDT
ncbi:hypothetical protein Chor_005583 [Crotalus horridus]